MKPFARRRARELALQAIYSWQLSKNSIFDIEYQFLSKLNFKKVDVIYFREILSGVVSNSIYLDQLIQLHLPNIFKKLGEIEKSVLRIALFELSKRDDIPYKVTINEAIELAKIFGSQNCHKFINGILDKIVAIKFFSKKSD